MKVRRVKAFQTYFVFVLDVFGEIMGVERRGGVSCPSITRLLKRVLALSISNSFGANSP